MNHAIILAAGQGQRMSMRKDKLLVHAAGHPLIYYPLSAFNDHPEIDTITIVVNKTNQKEIEKIVKFYRFHKVKKIVIGGSTRQSSLSKGLSALSKPNKDDVIIVHNAANPVVSFEEISGVIYHSNEHGACVAGHQLSSTIKEISGQHIIKTHDRKKLFSAETPQAAKFALLKKSLDHVTKKKIECTDEAMMLEHMGVEVWITPASENNFKITTQADLMRFRAVLGELPEDFRVGIGQDSHTFDDEKTGLTIGGITLPKEKKLQANSDGDVILHALFNALSQAIGDMSIGFYADEEAKKGITDSKKYLTPLLQKIKDEKFEINSLGLMIECGKPKIDPLVPKLKKSLSQILNLMPQRIGITATSGENLTVFGRGLGVQCFAIVSLVKNSD